ncbi:uncharacterized protein TM35_000024400 [Trypanosoma theileri]|uniref:Uncharacterized protein n=1 Tax=Trypanosoma theileri TaxID=67003 RepID=A0A1X0P865_9TRYP|nr:uncharacterized protein TM35_000024400 [Trypanosoma theileri]ORC93114.1 hypothetical protein TM35_000024400 [Trypanosoma theileri]
MIHESSPFKGRIFVFLLTLCLLLLVTAPVHANTNVEEKRKEKCGTSTDCVHVRASKAQLLVDDLWLDKDTPDTVLGRLPPWFGPKRPCALLSNQKKLDASQTLSSQGVDIGALLDMVSETELSKESHDL